jgi:RimJ/RimL family protein N-acetyltransferase
MAFPVPPRAGPLPTLGDSVVTLRPWRADDAGRLHREIQDGEIVRWLAIALPYTIEDAERFVDRASDRWERGEGAHLAMEAAADGRFLGYLGVLPVDGWRRVELVYWVAAAERRRGFASRGVALAVEWARTVLRPDRIELGMADGNEASARIAQRAGFVLAERRPGAATLDGRSVDEVVYVLEEVPG